VRRRRCGGRRGRRGAAAGCPRGPRGAQSADHPHPTLLSLRTHKSNGFSPCGYPKKISQSVGMRCRLWSSIRLSPSLARPLPSPALEEWFTQAMHAQAAPAACRVVAHLAYACRAQTLACPSLSCDCWQIINTPGHCQTMVWRRQTPRREDRPHPPCGPVLPQDVP